MLLAARGQRDMGNGLESITDPATLLQVRRQARKVKLRGMALATLATLALAGIAGGHQPLGVAGPGA